MCWASGRSHWHPCPRSRESSSSSYVDPLPWCGCAGRRRTGIVTLFFFPSSFIPPSNILVYCMRRGEKLIVEIGEEKLQRIAISLLVLLDKVPSPGINPLCNLLTHCSTVPTSPAINPLCNLLTLLYCIYISFIFFSFFFSFSFTRQYAVWRWGRVTGTACWCQVRCTALSTLCSSPLLLFSLYSCSFSSPFLHLFSTPLSSSFYSSSSTSLYLPTNAPCHPPLPLPPCFHSVKRHLQSSGHGGCMQGDQRRNQCMQADLSR